MSQETSFTETIIGGNTRRFIIDDLTDATPAAVTSGAAPAINLYDQNLTLVTTGDIQQADAPDDDTYYADILIPLVSKPTKFIMKATASKDGANYNAIGIVWALPE